MSTFNNDKDCHINICVNKTPLIPRNSIITRKLKKVLESDLEAEKDINIAISELSTFFTDNTLRTRRFLRGNIERKSLLINHGFFHELSIVKEFFENVFSIILAMTQNGKDIKKQLDGIKLKTIVLTTKTSTLQGQNNGMSVYEKTLNSFIKKYHLSREDLKIIKKDPTSKSIIKYFEILERVQTINLSCKELLTLESPTTPFEIIEQMMSLKENALGRLHKWVLSQCKSTETLIGNVYFFSKAIKFFQEDFQIFKRIINEYCERRRCFVTHEFLNALSLGGPNSKPNPIELNSHDPQRYVGDMLAWLHQLIPTEKEYLKNILILCNKVHIDIIIEESIVIIIEDTCKPLSTRIEQTLFNETDAVNLYKVTNVIQFYIQTIKQLVSVSSNFIDTLIELRHLAYKNFLTVLQNNVSQNISIEESTKYDLGPNTTTNNLLALIRDILSESSVIDNDPNELKEITSIIIDPLIESLKKLSKAFPRVDQDVFMLNSLYRIYLTLSVFQCSEYRIDNLQSDIQLYLAALSSEQTNSMITNLGFQKINTYFAKCDKSQALSKMNGMDPQSLEILLTKFDNFLIAYEPYMLPQLRLLNSSSHRKDILRRSFEGVITIYSQLYRAVFDPKNEYKNPTILMSKTIDQIKLLLLI